MDLITYVTDRKGHDMRYAIDSRKLQKELGREPSLQFEEGIEEMVKWYLDNLEWMDHVTSGEYQKYYENMYCNQTHLLKVGIVWETKKPNRVIHISGLGK